MNNFNVLAASLISLIVTQVHGQTQYGVLGFGIPMYDPLCCYSCHDALSSLYLNCTTFVEGMDGMHMDMKLAKRMDMGGDSMATTSGTCYATDQAWLETFSYCVHDKCSQEGIKDNKQAACFATLAAKGQSAPSLQSSLPSEAPTIQLKADSTWLNITSLVNEDTYSANYRTMKEFVAEEHSHTRYALISILYVVGVCLLTGVWRLHFSPYVASSILSIKLSQYLFVPALLGGRHLSPLPHQMGYMPRRGLSLFIATYVVLNVIFSAVSYHHVSPNAWYADRRHEIAAYVANRTGVLSFANLALAILFSGRNNLLIMITGWNPSTMLAIHRWASRVATVQAVVHSIIYTLTYFWTGGATDYQAEAAKPYYWWGIIATVVLCVSVALAILPIRIRSYEIFLITHIALAILALLGCWYHMDLRFGNKWGYKVWLYIAFAFWGFDRLMRFARLMYFNYSGSPIAVVKQIPHTNILQMTIFTTKAWNVRPGQHSFFYIPMLGKPWENHPFSIASWGISEPHQSTSRAVREDKDAGVDVVDVTNSHARSTQPGQMVCLMHARRGMTASLLRSLTESGAISLPFSILTEGLYGGPNVGLSPLKTADAILCVAGGIGITSAMSFLQQFTIESRQATGSSSQQLIPRATKLVLAWSAREESLIQHVSSSLLPDSKCSLPQGRSIDYQFWCTGSSSSQDKGLEHGNGVQDGRMNVNRVVRSVVEKGKKVVVVVCAPGGMSDEVRAAVIECLGEGMHVDLIEEAFTW